METDMLFFPFFLPSSSTHTETRTVYRDRPQAEPYKPPAPAYTPRYTRDALGPRFGRLLAKQAAGAPNQTVELRVKGSEVPLRKPIVVRYRNRYAALLKVPNNYVLDFGPTAAAAVANLYEQLAKMAVFHEWQLTRVTR